jgi:hypothetical protein
MSDLPPSSIAHPGRMKPSGPAGVREIGVPAAARAASTLGRVDYADCFLVAAELAPPGTAEQWSRTILEDAPPGTRRALQRGWGSLGPQPARLFPADRQPLHSGRPRPAQTYSNWPSETSELMRKPDTPLLILGMAS